MEEKTMLVTFALAVIFVVINGVTQMYMARGLGYKLKPTGFAYLVGAVANLFSGSVVPISGQAETLTLSGLIKDTRTRVAALLIAAAVGMTLGLTGSISAIVDFAGESAINGMMAGVGFILAMVGVQMCKEEKRTGWISMAAAWAIFALTHDLVYTIAGSVAL
jgi:AGZA family xanthine/uracil permease-like MFS transporter